MTEYVRVRDNESGTHLSLRRRDYEQAKESLTLLKSAAIYADGTPRPAIPRTSVSNEAAKKGRGQAAPPASPADPEG